MNARVDDRRSVRWLVFLALAIVPIFGKELIDEHADPSAIKPLTSQSG